MLTYIFRIIFTVLLVCLTFVTPSVAENDGEDPALLDSLEAQSASDAAQEQSADEFGSEDLSMDEAPADQMDPSEMASDENSDTPFGAEEAGQEPEQRAEAGGKEPISPTVAQRVKYTRGARPDRLNLLLGVEMIKQTTTTFIPNMEVDYALNLTTAVGLSAGLLRTETSSQIFRGLSALATVVYFPRGVYGGPVFQIAAGVRKYSSELDLGTGLAFQGSLGWRWHSSTNNGSFGVAFGPDVTKWNGGTEIALLARIHLGVDFLFDDIFY